MVALAARPLNAGLAAYPLQRQTNGEGTSLAEVADALIVAAPAYAKLQAIVLILDADPVAYGLPAIGARRWILVIVGNIDDLCSKARLVTMEEYTVRYVHCHGVVQNVDHWI